MIGAAGEGDNAPPAGRSRSIPVSVVLAFALAVAFWLSFAVPYSTIVADSDPEAALRVWPHARAHSRLAERLLTTGRAQGKLDRARISRLADKALRREPLDVVAARTLASIDGLEGDEVAARRAIGYAAHLSRRDLQTQIWLIEASVAHGDVTDALRHYDLALTTTRSGDDLLMPVLVQATATDEVAAQLARMIARRPLWTKPFLSRLIDGSPNLPAVVAIVEAARLNPEDELDQSLLARTLMRLFDTGHYALGYRLFQKSARSSDRGGPLRDGGFDRASRLPPFDWWFAAEADLSAVQENVGVPTDPVLSINAQSGHKGMVATQVVMLPTGSYTIAASAGRIDGNSILPSVVVQCDPAGLTLATLTFEVPGKRVGSRFAVPSGCVAQRVQVLIDPGIDGTAASAWVDSIVVRPIAAGRAGVSKS